MLRVFGEKTGYIAINRYGGMITTGDHKMRAAATIERERVGEGVAGAKGKVCAGFGRAGLLPKATEVNAYYTQLAYCV